MALIEKNKVKKRKIGIIWTILISTASTIITGSVLNFISGKVEIHKLNKEMEAHYHENDVNKKKDEEKLLLKNINLINQDIALINIKCANRKLGEIANLQESIIKSQFSLIYNTDSYRADFGNKSNKIIIQKSSEAVKYIDNYIYTLPKCSKINKKNLPTKYFNDSIRNSFEREILSEYVNLN